MRGKMVTKLIIMFSIDLKIIVRTNLSIVHFVRYRTELEKVIFKL